MNKFGLFLFAAAHLTSVLAFPSCACTRNFKPVCGTDGITYPNQCMLNCRRDETSSDLTIAKEGMCEPDPCVCTFDYKPVCGSDGSSYPNECSLSCARSTNPSLQVKYQGECEKVQVVTPPCACTREMKEVCGTDGKTYGNKCLLKCAKKNNSGLSVGHFGPCDSVEAVDEVKVDEASCTCARNYEPVCGSDGLTYNNECLMRCRGGRNVSIASYDAC